MKKTILAVALMAVTGAVQAQVTMSGKVGAYADRTEVGSRSATTVSTEPTNNINITASERVGKMTVRAVVETSIGNNTLGTAGTQLGDRQMTVGIDTGMAGLAFGRNTHGLFNTIAGSDVFGAVYGSLAGDVHNLRGLRLSDAAFATLSVNKNMGFGVDRTQGLAQDVTVLSGHGKVGPAHISLARYDAGSEESTVIAATTTLGGFNLTYSHSDNKGAYAHKGDLFGASRKIGNMTAKASYGRTNRDVDAYAIGVDYHLSKRTDLVVAYRSVDAKVAANDVSQVGFGIVHRF